VKTALLAGVAALSVLSAAAQSATKTELPDAMLGAWCGGGVYDEVEHLRHTVDEDGQRLEDANECANHGGVYIRKDGWDYYRFGPRGSCDFTSVEFSRRGQPGDRVRPPVLNRQKQQDEYAEPEYTEPEPTKTLNDVYLVRAICKFDLKSWPEMYEVQTGDNWLVRRPLAES
jgi:hypothetical protein